MKNIPTITINNPNRIINTNVPNTGGGSGNQFTNWTPPTENFGSNTSNPNSNIPTFNPPNINIPSNTPIVNTGDKYGLDNLKDLPRIANEKEFAATCHGSIAVNSIIDHAITRNSQGYGPNALASLKTFDLSHNYLGDEEIKKLNAGLYGYTLNLQVFNFCNNKMGAVGLDHLIKGSIGIDHLQKGGKDIHNMMQGILTLPSTSIVCLNLANNNIGDIGADILGHALANGKLPATKNIDVSGNGITDKGAGTIGEALKTGKFPTLKRFDVSGNDVSLVGEKFMIDALKHPSTQDIIILLKKSTDLKNQLKMSFGTKEQKVEALCSKLKEAEAMGVDTKQVAVSKSLSDKVFGQLKGVGISGWGASKCHLIPDSIKSFAEDIIVGKVSKKLELAHNANSLIACYLEHENDRLASDSGVELIKEELVDLVGTADVCDSM